MKRHVKNEQFNGKLERKVLRRRKKLPLISQRQLIKLHVY